ncbi:MAG: class I SAM-dependent methyltransferase [Anaerolineaceae bacterium]
MTVEFNSQSDKAALRGEPSYVWRAGQERRLNMIRQYAGERINGIILEDGCGVGEYLQRLNEQAALAVGLDVDFERVLETHQKGLTAQLAVGEALPHAAQTFDLVISNEVIEHVQNDWQAVAEIVRVLKPGGRLVLFCPNRGYPFETHGIYRKGKYHFGNKLFVNYLPNCWRNKLAPHVRVYRSSDLKKLFTGLPVRFIYRTTIFGGYDNIIRRSPALGKMVRGLLQFLEKTPVRGLGLSHFWVVEKI